MHLSTPVPYMGNLLGNVRWQGTDSGMQGNATVSNERRSNRRDAACRNVRAEQGRFASRSDDRGDRRVRGIGAYTETGEGVYLTSDRAPASPSGMVLRSRPHSLRSMFASSNLQRIYVIGGTEPLSESSYDQEPVMRSIYFINFIFDPPTWTLAFDGGTIAPNLVEMQACIGLLVTEQDHASATDAVYCSYTSADDDRIRIFRLAGSEFSFSVAWDGNLTVADPHRRKRFHTEMAVAPQVEGQQQRQQHFTDILMGVPMPNGSSAVARIRLMPASNNYSLLGTPEEGREGAIGDFVSLRATRSALFALDEQPALWRWNVDETTPSGFGPSVMTRPLQTGANSVWKIMLWSNNRLVLASSDALYLWTQCARCPAGTVSSDDGQRCLCPAGTYQSSASASYFKALCKPCTTANASSSCPGGYYRTLLDPVCPVAGNNTYDQGCARCTRQADCPPKHVATGTPCTGAGVSNTVECKICPNPCTPGESFISNDCSVDGYSVCTACKDTCGQHRFVGRACSIDHDAECRQCNLTCPERGQYMNRTCRGTERLDVSR